jgi:hypothetical protein
MPVCPMPNGQNDPAVPPGTVPLAASTLAAYTCLSVQNAPAVAAWIAARTATASQMPESQAAKQQHWQTGHGRQLHHVDDVQWIFSLCGCRLSRWNVHMSQVAFLTSGGTIRGLSVQGIQSPRLAANLPGWDICCKTPSTVRAAVCSMQPLLHLTGAQRCH